jgi:hypothetical protein
LNAQRTNRLTLPMREGLPYEKIFLLIEGYCNSHLNFIQDLEFMFRYCQKIIDETEDSNIKNMCNSTIGLLERDLRDFRDMTPKVVRNTGLIKLITRRY